MNKYMLNLISSIVSLFMVFILLVFVSLAWYCQNTTASVSGISGVTAGADFTDISLTRYIANETTSNETTMYSTGDEVSSSNVEPYDLVNAYSKIIYKISFKTSNDSYSLSMTNTMDRNNQLVVDTLNTSIYYNYLSNVAVFNVLSGSDSFSISDTNCSFEYCDSSTSDSTRYTVSIVNESDSTDDLISLYLLFDYNNENINKLFTANLGKNGTVSFYEDIMFVLQ